VNVPRPSKPKNIVRGLSRVSLPTVMSGVFERGERRACGNCTACCYTQPVAELDKPAGTPCRFCRTSAKKGKRIGCTIYKDRPASCREYECAWKLGILTATERPDRSGVVIAAGLRFRDLGDDVSDEEQLERRIGFFVAKEVWPGAARRDDGARALLALLAERSGVFVWPAGEDMGVNPETGIHDVRMDDPFLLCMPETMDEGMAIFDRVLDPDVIRRLHEERGRPVPTPCAACDGRYYHVVQFFRSEGPVEGTSLGVAMTAHGPRKQMFMPGEFEFPVRK
jgi:hypothetical protein